MKGIFAIIPAREKSKGVPLKNLRKLKGDPLIVWSIKAALIANVFEKIFVSTESKRIANVASRFNVEICNRPEELSKDDTPSEDVVAHVIRTKGLKDVKGVALIQCTTPLVSPLTIRSAILRFINSKEICSVVTVCKDYGYIGKKDGQYFIPFRKKRERRQNMEPYLKETGALYISKPEVWLKGNRFDKKIKYILMPKQDSFEIDDFWDLIIVEALLNAKDIYNSRDRNKS